MSQGTVASIHVYPVKSLGGVSRKSARVEHRGLRHDRRWMVVDPQGVFITQREIPRMSLIATELESNLLRLRAPGLPPLELELPAAGGKEIPVVIFGETYPAITEEARVDEWLSRHLGRAARLVYMPDSTRRPVGPGFARGEGIVSFAAECPLLLISQGSLDDLNSRLESPVGMNRFRPNLMVSGTNAFEEDAWLRIRIGAVEFYGLKNCGRCVMTTVNPERGEFDGKDPLLTLSGYRKVGSKINFGRDLAPVAPGEIHVGDAVEVLEKL